MMPQHFVTNYFSVLKKKNPKNSGDTFNMKIIKENKTLDKDHLRS